MHQWFKSNQGVGCILTLLLIALFSYVQCSSWAHRELRDGFTLGFFPSIAIFLSLFFSTILIFDSRRKKVLPDLENLTFKHFLCSIIAVIVCWIYFLLMKKIGYLVTTPFFLLFSMYLLGLKSWRNVILAAAIMTVTIYWIFTVMGIELFPVTLSGLFNF